MRSLRRLLCIASSSLLTLTSCGTVPPKASQPRLEEVRVLGQRVCSPFTAVGNTYQFVCQPLPTIVSSGWLLTPAARPLASRPNMTRPNDVAVLVVTTPSRTTIEVSYVPSHRAKWIQRQVAPALGGYDRVGKDGSVEVGSSDDGTTKTWFITVHMWTCLEVLPLEIVNVSGNGPSRSNPLSVTLFRPSADVYCPPGTPPPSPQRENVIWYQIPAGSGSQTSTPPTTCPGGAALTQFQTCLLCPRGAGAPIADYVVYEGCSFNEIKNRALTPETAAQCSFTQVANLEQCVGGP